MTATVWKTLDARPLLARGEHPVERVLSDLAGLPEGQAYDLLTPFVPQPLIDRAGARGFVGTSADEAPGLVRTRFVRGGGAA